MQAGEYGIVYVRCQMVRLSLVAPCLETLVLIFAYADEGALLRAENALQILRTPHFGEIVVRGADAVSARRAAGRVDVADLPALRPDEAESRRPFDRFSALGLETDRLRPGAGERFRTGGK